MEAVVGTADAAGAKAAFLNKLLCSAFEHAEALYTVYLVSQQRAYISLRSRNIFHRPTSRAE